MRLLGKEMPRYSRRPRGFGDARTMGQQPPRAAATEEWNQPEPRRQSVWSQKAELESDPDPFLGGAQKIITESQTMDIELFILLEFGFAMICL